jgi:RNA polymerase sigma-70 factor, ECF subfamily
MPDSQAQAGPSQFEDGYAQLRTLAASYMRRFSAGHTLQATALVHEVYLKLAKEPRQYADHVHFVCTAAAAMRQILVDYARARNRLKRGGEFCRVTLDGEALASKREIDVLVLNDALDRLAAWDPRQSRIVELRFFVGLSVEEVAALLDVSEKTVKRDWAMARAWLQRELGPSDPSRPTDA